MTSEVQQSPAFRRVLLKISGEALIGEQTFGIDINVARMVAQEIKQVHDLGIEVAVVVGGGNIFRGVSKSAGGMDRASTHACSQRSTFLNLPNHSFAAGRSATWRSGEL